MQRSTEEKAILSLLRRRALLRSAKEKDLAFERWIETERFPHPETKNEVKFVSLPPQEQAKWRQRWEQKHSQDPARGEQRSQSPKWRTDRPDGKGGPSQEELAKAREEFFNTPSHARPSRWVTIDRGNAVVGQAQIGPKARVTNSRVSGKIEDSAEVDSSSVEHGSRVEGNASVTKSQIEEDSIVEGDAVLNRAQVSRRARIRGTTEINNAIIRGGSWDGQKIKDGRGGVFHEAWDQDTLDVLGSIKPRSSLFGHSGMEGPGDGPLMAMVRYLEEGGRTKGWLGGDHDRKALTKKIKKHVYDRHDRKDPWLGTGASYLDDLSEDHFNQLLQVAQRKANELRANRKQQKKAMLYFIAKRALETPSLRPSLMPLLRLGRDSRVASGELDLRRVLIRVAYVATDPQVKSAILQSIIEGDQLAARTLLASKGTEDTTLEIHSETYRRLIRVAYNTSNTERKRHIIALLKQAKYSPSFLKWVEHKTWPHPTTKNEVKFVSLPPDMRSEIHDQWVADKKEWSQKFKPEGLTEETLLTPKKFDELKKGEVLWISWTPKMLHRVTGRDKTKSGKPVLEMALVDPKTGKDVATRYLYRSSAGDPKHEIHVVPPAGKEAPAQKEKEPPAAEPPKAEPSPPKKTPPKTPEEKELPEPDDALRSLEESGFLGVMAPGAKKSPSHTWHKRGDRILVTTKSGKSAEFTILDKFLIRDHEGGEFLLALSDTGPTLVPWHGPKAAGLRHKSISQAAAPKSEPKSEPKRRERENSSISKNMEGTPDLGEKQEQFDTEVADLMSEWEGSNANFQDLKDLGKKHYGEKFNKVVHQQMLHGVSQWMSEVAEQLREDHNGDDADLWEDWAKEISEKASTLPEDSSEKTQGHVPTGKHKDRKELLGKPSKKGTDDTQMPVSKELVALAAPEGMEASKREQTAKQMEGLTLGAATKLLRHLGTALKDPDGLYSKTMLENGYTAEGIKKLHEALRRLTAPYRNRRYTHPVLEMANKYDLEPEDADELFAFRADRPGYGRKLSDVQIMQKFLQKASPETRERMQGMTLADFMVMYKAILAEEDEEDELSVTPAAA